MAMETGVAVLVSIDRLRRNGSRGCDWGDCLFRRCMLDTPGTRDTLTLTGICGTFFFWGCIQFEYQKKR